MNERTPLQKKLADQAKSSAVLDESKKVIASMAGGSA